MRTPRVSLHQQVRRSRPQTSDTKVWSQRLSQASSRKMPHENNESSSVRSPACLIHFSSWSWRPGKTHSLIGSDLLQMTIERTLSCTMKLKIGIMSTCLSYCEQTLTMFESLSTLSQFVLCCALLVPYVYRRANDARAGKPYPPGPPRLPFIGSLLHVPKDHEWLAYERMGKQYGGHRSSRSALLKIPIQVLTEVGVGSDLVHLDVLGSHIIVVNSAKAANELFEKRSAIYSDRYVLYSSSRH